MRRLLVCIVVLIASFIEAAPALACECRVIYIYRPDGQPPIEIEICP